MQIKTVLKSIYSKFRNNQQQFVYRQICGISLQVVDGTIREVVDQDDTWWFYLAKHHNIIFDIGCNVGYTALLALIQDSDKKLILVDPNPKALQMAAINIIQNGLGRNVNYALGFVGNTIDDQIKFYTVGSGAAGSMYPSHAKTASATNAFIDVKTFTLDYLYMYYKIIPDLVKIDVEGAETLVMQAGKKLAKDTQCSFFIEMHNVENLGMEAAGKFMLDWCSEMDYKAWYLKTGEELITAETIKGRGKCHLLLMPKSKQYPDYLSGISQSSSLPESI